MFLHGTVYLLLTLTIFFLAGCRKHDHPYQKGMNLQLVTDGLVSPLSVVEPADLSHRLFIVDQPGKIWIVDSSGVKTSQSFFGSIGKYRCIESAL